jgi:hypothetical protein
MPALTRYQSPTLKLPFAWKFSLALLLLVLLAVFKPAFYSLGTSAQKQTGQNPGIVRNPESSPISGVSPSAEVKNVKAAPKSPAASPASSPAPAVTPVVPAPTPAPAPAAPASVPAVVSVPAPAPVPAPPAIHQVLGAERDDGRGGGDE